MLIKSWPGRCMVTVYGTLMFGPRSPQPCMVTGYGSLGGELDMPAWAMVTACGERDAAAGGFSESARRTERPDLMVYIYGMSLLPIQSTW